MTGSPSPADRGGPAKGPFAGPSSDPSPPLMPSAFRRDRARVVGPASRVASIPTPIGDGEWVASVLRLHEGALVLFAARITRDAERARDVVQEAFLKLMQADRREVEPHVVEWLYTVCRNKALDVRRKESRVTALAEGSLEREPATGPTVGERLEQSESSAEALRLLNRLPDNQQEVIRLRFQNGLSYQQISDVTGLTVTNVGFLLHVGLKALRERMGKK